MFFAHKAGAVRGLEIERPCLDNIPGGVPVPAKPAHQIDPHQPVNKLFDGEAVPPAVHIGFAKAQCGLTYHPGIEGVIVDLDIVGAAPF